MKNIVKKVESGKKLMVESQKGTESALRAAADVDVGAPLSTREAGETPALPSGPWTDFLASKPEERRLQFEIIAKICEAFKRFGPAFGSLTQQHIDTAEMGRVIGEFVVELEERLPGKKLTEDFWRQMEAVFALNTGGAITREMLVWFGKAARHCQGRPITTIHQALAMQKELNLASGQPEFQLEAHRAPQQLHAPMPPITALTAMFNYSEMSEKWAAVKADGKLFVDGRLRPDLRDRLRVDFEKPVQLFEEIKRELGF